MPDASFINEFALQFLLNCSIMDTAYNHIPVILHNDDRKHKPVQLNTTTLIPIPLYIALQEI